MIIDTGVVLYIRIAMKYNLYAHVHFRLKDTVRVCYLVIFNSALACEPTELGPPAGVFECRIERRFSSDICWNMTARINGLGICLGLISIASYGAWAVYYGGSIRTSTSMQRNFT